MSWVVQMISREITERGYEDITLIATALREYINTNKHTHAPGHTGAALQTPGSPEDGHSRAHVSVSVPEKHPHCIPSYPTEQQTYLLL